MATNNITCRYRGYHGKPTDEIAFCDDTNWSERTANWPTVPQWHFSSPLDPWSVIRYTVPNLSEDDTCSYYGLTDLSEDDHHYQTVEAKYLLIWLNDALDSFDAAGVDTVNDMPLDAFREAAATGNADLLCKGLYDVYPFNTNGEIVPEWTVLPPGSWSPSLRSVTDLRE